MLRGGATEHREGVYCPLTVNVVAALIWNEMQGCGLPLNSDFLDGRRWVMPLYFFHLSFGDRTVPDDEGVELPNRSAAREEALAVVRDLSNPEVAGNPRRWASWFLQVADEGGEFLRMPIGHPALEVVASDGQQPQAESSEMKPIRPATRQGRRSASLVQQMSAVRKQTEQLLQRNQQLRHELSVVCLASESIRVRASRLVSLARRAGSPTGDIEAYRIANKPTRHTPHLVVLPGG